MTVGHRWCVGLVALAALPMALLAQQRITQQAAQAPDGVAVAPVMLPQLPSDPSLPRTPNGRHYPLVPTTPQATASLLAALEAAIRDPAVPVDRIPPLAHQQQVIYRVLSRDPQRGAAVRTALAPRWHWVFDQHIAARREFLAMHRGPATAQVPAWRIQQPAPEAQLLRAYRSASQATGIPWTVLAAVNLVETGLGRIDGVSVANAQGPMQFLPSTWAEAGIGQGGNIRDPWDAIHAAARYLVRRGGLNDIRKGLWGYNNSDHYGEAVLRYAALMDRDPLAYRGFYQWQIHYASVAGDLWLEEGYARTKPASALQHTREFPHSKPPSTLP
ncbi:MAG: lytic transglycosylase domain-containing protein [Synechococcus sp.]